MGWAFASIGLCIMHDGSHGAFSTIPLLNQLACGTMDMIGANANLWEVAHIVGHHPNTNQATIDPDVFSSYPFIRHHPEQALKWYHKFQYIYAFLLYGALTMSKVFWSDVEAACLKGSIGIFSIHSRFSPNNIQQKEKKNSMITYVTTEGGYQRLFLTKLFFFVIIQLVIPCSCHGLTLGFFYISIAHFVAGFYLALFFSLSHISETLTFLKPTAVGTLPIL